MSHLNIEIKARCANPQAIRDILRSQGADFRGTDYQTDTYFKVERGRLKLREGNIENALVYYEREDQEGPKQAQVTLYPTTPGSGLKEILTQSLGILVVVKKQREIYFIDNVKFHLDTVDGLGTFAEIEAIDQGWHRWDERNCLRNAISFLSCCESHRMIWLLCHIVTCFCKEPKERFFVPLRMT